MNCSYCNNEAELSCGMPNSSEDSPEIEFWHCKNCEHTWMSEEQQKALAEKLPVTR